MAEIAPFDINESAWARASRETGQMAGSPFGIAVLTVIGALSGAGMAWATIAHPRWNETLRVLTPFASAALGVLLSVFALLILRRAVAPGHQRDEARARLRGVKSAVETVSIVPTKVRLRRPDPPLGSLVICTVKNDGRLGQFAVTIDSIEGAVLPLEEPNLHLLWWDRGGVIAEEIPTGESRPIVVGSVHGSGGVLQYRSVSPYATHREPASMAKGDQLTVWFRVSLRNQPEMSYTRRIGVVITLAPGGPSAAFAPDPPDAERTETAVSFASLLDFGPSSQ